MFEYQLAEVWVITCTAVVFLMQAGFVCYEAGLARSKNSIDIACKNLFDFCVAVLVFWCIGFGLMFGDTWHGMFGTAEITHIDRSQVPSAEVDPVPGAEPSESPTLLIHSRSMFFSDLSNQHWPTIFFLFQMVYCGTSITIVSGAVGERMRFIPYVVLAVAVGMFIYPVFGHWAWAGIGRDGPGGNPELVGLLGRMGFIDFAGSTVLHSLGAWVALAGVIWLRPRIDKYPDGGQPRKLQGHNLPLAVMGLFILWFGWFGLTGGRTFAPDANVPVLLVNTMLAGVAGGVGGLLGSLLGQHPRFRRWSWHLQSAWRPRDHRQPAPGREDPMKLSQAKFSVESIMSGILAGLVAISASCHVVAYPSAIVIGLIAAFIMHAARGLLEYVLRIDDEVGAISTHGFAGVWGTWAVAIFIQDPFLNGVTRWQLFGTQLLGTVLCLVWAFSLTAAVLWILRRLARRYPFFKLRPTPEEEERGMNVVEHGVSTEYERLVGQMWKQLQGEEVRELPVQEFSEMQLMAELVNRVAEAKRAVDANRAKDEFLRSMSHEIRQPMTAILGYADLLNQRLQQLQDSEGVENVRTIIQQGNYLLALLNDILDLSKIEAGKLSLNLRPLRLAELVEDVRRLMSIKSEAKGLVFSIGQQGRLPTTIVSDETRLRQILVNLLSNAIKFTEAPGTVQLILQLEQLGDDDNWLRFDIVDTGIGMSAEQQSQLFQPFTQFDSNSGGTGLGLTISQRLTEMLGGEIRVRSQPDQGSVFWIRIPSGSLQQVELVDDLQATSKAPRKPPAPRSSLPAGFRVLLVEDADENRKLISHLLRRAGATVEAVEHGQAGLESALAAWADGHPYDLVLMDMRMPVKDGYDATRDLRAAGYVAPIVALTAHAMSNERAKCLEAGCDDFITKPLPKDLAQRLAQYPRPPAGKPPRLYSSEEGDTELRPLIAELIAEMPQLCDQISESLERGDLEELEDRVHKLKGIVGLYGFHHATPLAQHALAAIRGKHEDADIRHACTALQEVLGRLSLRESTPKEVDVDGRTKE